MHLIGCDVPCAAAERIVSVAWFEPRTPADHTYARGPPPPLGGLLAAGSPGTIRLWNVASCTALSHIDLRGPAAAGPVVPWALCFTRCALLCSAVGVLFALASHPNQ